MSVIRYLCGHDHNLQHIRESTSPVDYFVTGAGHLTNPSVAHKVSYFTRQVAKCFFSLSLQDNIPPGSLKFHYGLLDVSHDKGGYTTVNITTDIMTTTFYDYKGIPYYVVESDYSMCSLVLFNIQVLYYTPPQLPGPETFSVVCIMNNVTYICTMLNSLH